MREVVFTPETFALTVAPLFVEERGGSLVKARARFWRFSRDFILRALKKGGEMEFPHGSGMIYRKLGREYFTVRRDQPHANWAPRRKRRPTR